MRESTPVWRKSSFSTEQEFGTCVEVAETEACLAVRDSKNPAGPQLRFSLEAWSAFVGSIRSRRL